MRHYPVVVFLILFTRSLLGHAEPGGEYVVDEVVDPWVPAPGAPPPDLPPAPEGNRPELARRPAEIGAGFGVTLPLCSDRFGSATRCSNTERGKTVGFTALWRSTPAFAWGVYGEVTRFELRGPSSSRGKTDALVAGVLGRVYLFDSGKLDPWVELGLGGGVVAAMSADEIGLVEHTSRRTGFSTRIGAGFDFLVSARLRLGPVIDYDRVLSQRQRSCTGRDCRDRGLGRVDEGLTFGLGMTLSLGSPM